MFSNITNKEADHWNAMSENPMDVFRDELATALSLAWNQKDVLAEFIINIYI